MTTIAEVKSMQTGFPVIDLKAVITGIKEPKTGTGQYGPYSFQDITLSDGKDTIVAKLSNWPALAEKNLNTPVILSSYKSKKDGKWVGAMTADDKYAGVVIKVSKTAKFEPTPEETPSTVETPKTPEITPKKAVSVDQDEKIRTFAVSYAKDLCCKDKITVLELLPIAETLANYMKTGNTEIVLPVVSDVVNCDEPSEAIPF